MIRRSCAACGRPINRTDRFFEASDGTLCQDCQARLAPVAAGPRKAWTAAALPPPLSQLPELALAARR